MKITKIQKNNDKLSQDDLQALATELQYTLFRAGFRTNAKVVNSSRIDLGLHMKSFVIDINKLGYNARYSPYCSSKKGFRRTSSPTWDQRVEYNNLVNEVLTKWAISANVKSGEFTIRQGKDELTEKDWQDQKPSWYYRNEANGYYVAELPEGY